MTPAVAGSMTDAWTIRGAKHEYTASDAGPQTCSRCGRSAGFVLHKRTTTTTTKETAR